MAIALPAPSLHQQRRFQSSESRALLLFNNGKSLHHPLSVPQPPCPPHPTFEGPSSGPCPLLCQPLTQHLRGSHCTQTHSESSGLTLKTLPPSVVTPCTPVPPRPTCKSTNIKALSPLPCLCMWQELPTASPHTPNLSSLLLIP